MNVRYNLSQIDVLSFAEKKQSILSYFRENF